jgi:hypothetical protein
MSEQEYQCVQQQAVQDYSSDKQAHTREQEYKRAAIVQQTDSLPKVQRRKRSKSQLVARKTSSWSSSTASDSESSKGVSGKRVTRTKRKQLASTQSVAVPSIKVQQSEGHSNVTAPTNDSIAKVHKTFFSVVLISCIFRTRKVACQTGIRFWPPTIPTCFSKCKILKETTE